MENPDAKIFIAASGTAVSQGREALLALQEAGLSVGLIKIKSIRPFPEAELVAATEKAELIVVPKFNAGAGLPGKSKRQLATISGLWPVHAFLGHVNA